MPLHDTADIEVTGYEVLKGALCICKFFFDVA
jgi:hypothetical protein